MTALMSQLDDRLIPLAEQFLAQCKAAGLDCRITVTWRGEAAQNAAKAANLSRAKFGDSPHNCHDQDGQPCSRAFDFAIFRDGEYVKNGSDSAYSKAGQIGEKLGLTYGGRWHTPDFDHLQLPNWRNLT